MVALSQRLTVLRPKLLNIRAGKGALRLPANPVVRLTQIHLQYPHYKKDDEGQFPQSLTKATKGAYHFDKDYLPGIKYYNPALPIEVANYPECAPRLTLHFESTDKEALRAIESPRARTTKTSTSNASRIAAARSIEEQHSPTAVASSDTPVHEETTESSSPATELFSNPTQHKSPPPTSSVKSPVGMHVRHSSTLAVRNPSSTSTPAEGDLPISRVEGGLPISRPTLIKANSRGSRSVLNKRTDQKSETRGMTPQVGRGSRSVLNKQTGQQSKTQGMTPQVGRRNAPAKLIEVVPRTASKTAAALPKGTILYSRQISFNLDGRTPWDIAKWFRYRTGAETVGVSREDSKLKSEVRQKTVQAAVDRERMAKIQVVRDREREAMKQVREAAERNAQEAAAAAAGA